MRWDVTYSKEKSRMYLLLEGIFSDEETTLVVERILQMLKDEVSNNFDLLTDMASFRPLTQLGTKEVQRATNAMAAKGIRRAARVVGVSPTATLQMQRAAQTAGYTSKLFETRSEAEAYLDAELVRPALPKVAPRF